MYTDKKGNTWYKLGLHTHTTRSDGRVDPEKAAEIYKNAGYDAIALTDHWTYGEAGTLAGLKILSGCEYNLGGGTTDVCVMHIVGVGMTADPGIEKETATPKTVVEAIERAGGLAILAHPAWSLNTLEQIEGLSFAATEIYNTVSEVGQSDRAYSGYFVDVLANAGRFLPLLAVDDTHYYDGNDETKAFIMARLSALTEQEIKRAVREGDFYASQGPELYTRMENGTLVIDCSPCSKIVVFSNLAWVSDRVERGESLVHKEYVPRPDEKYVRVEVTDKTGRMAWSNLIVL